MHALAARSASLLALVLTLALALALLSLPAMALAQTRNVILIIGDGMDDQQITIARNYLQGPTGRLLLDTLPLRSSVQVLTVDETDPTVPLYVAESAGSGTAMAAGITTSRARISTTPATDKPVPTILELAQKAGMKTGVVTTASVTDATPAVFMSHINIRGCENPDSMQTDEFSCTQYLKQNGGAGSIAEQIATSSVDVVLGGGSEHFDQSAEGEDRSVADVAKAAGFTILRTPEALAANNSDRALGLFAEEHLPVKLRGENGRVAEKPDPSFLNQIFWAFGDVSLPEPMACETNPAFEGIPPLAQMTETAIALLQTGVGAENGFALIIESASIDKKSHTRDACGSIGEVQQLEESLAVALAYAADHGDTLVLVTADHSQAAQLVPNESLFALFGVPVYTPGYLARISMPSGGVMAVNYATNDFFAEEHTGAAVPLFANRTDLNIPPFMIQSDVFQTMRRFLGL